MRAVLVAFVAGTLFGLGLTISRMIDPAKVLGFLDVTGNWDPSLALVMVGALAVMATAYRIAGARAGPLLTGAFRIPTRRDVDSRLVTGAVIFGVGWGLVGFCPGPAVSGLALGRCPTSTPRFTPSETEETKARAARLLPTVTSKTANQQEPPRDRNGKHPRWL